MIAKLLATYPDAPSLAAAEEAALSETLRPLGLHRRRAKTLVAFSAAFARGVWRRPEELPGIGQCAQTIRMNSPNPGPDPKTLSRVRTASPVALAKGPVLEAACQVSLSRVLLLADAADAFAIFCEGRGAEVEPHDHALRWYVDWLRALEASHGRTVAGSCSDSSF